MISLNKESPDNNARSLETTNRLTDTFELIGRTPVDVFQGHNWSTMDGKVGLTKNIKENCTHTASKKRRIENGRDKKKLNWMVYFFSFQSKTVLLCSAIAKKMIR